MVNALQSILKPYDSKKPVKKVHKYPTEEERVAAEKASRKRISKKYQQTESFKQYKRDYYTRKAFEKYKEYIDDNTDDNYYDVINNEMTRPEMKKAFIKKYGQRKYDKYIK